MKSPRIGVSVLAALLVAAAAFGQDAEPEKHVLKEAPTSPGDVYVVASRNNLELQVRSVPEGSTEALVDAPFVLNVQEKFTQSVLAVSGGNPVHYTRKYNISKVTQTKMPGADPTTANLPRHGKTLTVRVKGKAITITSGKDKLPASEIALLKRILSGDSNVNPYPDHPVGPGDEWTKEGKAIVKDAPGATRKLQGKFLDVVEYEGHRCARISITMDVTSDVGGLPIQATLTGEVKHALDIHRDLIVSLSGDVNGKRKVTGNGITVDLTTQGTSSVTQTEVWLKSKGKPVTKPKPASPAQTDTVPTN